MAEGRGGVSQRAEGHVPSATGHKGKGEPPVQHHAGGDSHYALMPMLSDEGELRSIEDIEGELIRFAIDFHKGRMTKVAKSLGIGRSTLYRKLKDLGLEHGNDRDAAE
jgi:DNA-binding NtrC family response regulator